MSVADIAERLGLETYAPNSVVGPVSDGTYRVYYHVRVKGIGDVEIPKDATDEQIIAAVEEAKRKV